MSTGAKRGKGLPIDSPAAKFLYTIIKQLDLKSVDWNLVANQLEISNGHAARMRYSRFRQQMEGTTGAPRQRKKNANKGEKGNNPKADLARPPASPQPTMVKQENGVFVKHEQETPPNQELNMFVKPEPVTTTTGLEASPIKHDSYMQRPLNLADIPAYVPPPMIPAQSPTPQPMAPQSMTSQPMTPQPMVSPYPPMTVAPVDLTSQSPLPAFSSPPPVASTPPPMDYGYHANHHHVWAPIKMDPYNYGDIFIKTEVPGNHSGHAPAYW